MQLESEVERLNEMKRANMSKFIAATRTELNKIWNACFYGKQQRQEFGPAYSGEYMDYIHVQVIGNHQYGIHH